MFQAVLGASAVESERNLIQMETKDSNRKDLKAPIVSLTLGKKDMVCWKKCFSKCVDYHKQMFKDVQNWRIINVGASASTNNFYLRSK